MKASILVPLIFGIITKISATPLVYGLGEFLVCLSRKSREDDLIVHILDSNVCDGAVTLASSWIGAAKNVEVKSVFCPNLYQRDELEQRQTTNSTNVCGAPCKFTHDFLFRF